MLQTRILAFFLESTHRERRDGKGKKREEGREEGKGKEKGRGGGERERRSFL